MVLSLVNMSFNIGWNYGRVVEEGLVVLGRQKRLGSLACITGVYLHS